MASTKRLPTNTLNQRLLTQPYRFEFFQLVRVLSWICRRQEQSVTLDRIFMPSSMGQHGTGGEDSPGRAVIRFRSAPSFEFPWASVASVCKRAIREQNPKREALQFDVVAAIMALPGASGVLPEHYTELLLNRIRQKDPALHDLLDVLSHRSVSFFYRAWAKYRLPLVWEESHTEADSTGGPFSIGLRSLIGLGTGEAARHSGIDERFLLYFSGHLARQVRPAAVLRQVLMNYLGMPVEIVQFFGSWLVLDRQHQTRLPTGGKKNGQHHQLGISALAGDKIWDVNRKFRVRLGPVSYAQFLTLVPGGKLFEEVCRVVRLFVGPQLVFDVQVLLRADEVPKARLRGVGTERPGLRRNAWLRSSAYERDADDAAFACA